MVVMVVVDQNFDSGAADPLAKKGKHHSHKVTKPATELTLKSPL